MFMFNMKVGGPPHLEQVEPVTELTSNFINTFTALRSEWPESTGPYPFLHLVV